MPIAALGLASGLLAGGARHAVQRTRAPLTLGHDNGRWSLSRGVLWPQRSPLQLDDCRLLRGGYRSATLLVLRFETDEGRRASVEIHRAAVTADAFARLHLAQAYAAEDPAPRPLLPLGRALRRAALHSPARLRSDDRS